MIRLATLTLAFLVFTPMAQGHLLLYENVEINLHDPSLIRVEFTIHAPELPSAVARGVDPAAVTDDWLRGLDDEAIEQLIKEAEVFIRNTFLVDFGSETLRERTAIAFESPEQIRNPPPDAKLPAGCLLATLEKRNTLPNSELTVGFAPNAQKRLMVVVARPTAFPEVHDLAPGESVSISLPTPPPTPVVREVSVAPSDREKTGVSPLVVAAICGLGLGFFIWKKRNR